MKIMKIKATVCSIPRFGTICTPGGRINIDSNGFKHKLTG